MSALALSVQQQQQPPQQVQQPQVTAAQVLPPAVTTPRPNRLLYRRGLPDLPELIEVEEDEGTTDDVSMNTYSTRHSTCTSISSREFPSIATLSTGPLKPALSPLTQPIQPFHEIYTQTPPGSVSQLQTPFDYVPSSTFRYNPQHQAEDSPPPSPTPRDEALVNAGMGYGLGVSLAASGNCHADESGIVDEHHESGIDSDVYGDSVCLLENCPECFSIQVSPYYSFGPYRRSSLSGEVNSSEVREYMSPPSSPGTDCLTLEY